MYIDEGRDFSERRERVERREQMIISLSPGSPLCMCIYLFCMVTILHGFKGHHAHASRGECGDEATNVVD